ncbi:MAG: hypothetical protein SFV15_17495 [Polyangiaceae bacterium]|nr:hypothetical protein [Polyangiaceae bacterium]
MFPKRHYQILAAIAVGLVVVEACHSQGLNAPEGTEPEAAAGFAGRSNAAPPPLKPFRPDLLGTGGGEVVPTPGGGAGGRTLGSGGADAGSLGGVVGMSGGVANTGGFAGSPPVSTMCGDGIRDPLSEECDDGPGAAEDLCTPDCHARAIIYPAPGGPVWRHLEPSRHVSSAGAEGFAVVYTLSSPLRVFLSRFDAGGSKVGVDIEVSLGAMPAGDPNPGVAALPSGRYAVAWTDNNGGPRAAFRMVEADGGLGTVVYAPSSGSANGRDVDLLWVGGELIVAWENNLDVNLRRFDANGAPLAGEEMLAASSASESTVVLAPLASGYAQAWRSGRSGRESIFVHTNGSLWATEEVDAGPIHNRPALVQLDATHILLVFTETTDPINLGIPTVARLRGAILDNAAPGPVQSFPLPPLVAPFSDATISQQRPTLARVGDRIYLSWQSGSPPCDPLSGEVWIQELAWSSVGPTMLVREPEVPLGGIASRLGSQQEPSIGAAPLLSNGALISAFENGVGSRAELVVALKPVPFLVPGSAPAN